MSKFGIVLFAHGSRDPLWHRPMLALAQLLRERQSGAPVACAYLELSTPDLQTACEALLAQELAEIRIIPLFLGVGKHAREDLPLLVEELRQRWPGTTFTLRRAVGEDPRLLQTLADIALDAD